MFSSRFRSAGMYPTYPSEETLHWVTAPGPRVLVFGRKVGEGDRVEVRGAMWLDNAAQRYGHPGGKGDGGRDSVIRVG